MPEHLRALVVILLLAILVFTFAKRPVCSFSECDDFIRRRNLWFGLTLIAFLAHNFWLYVALTGSLLLLTALRETNKVALFFFLLFAVPPMRAEIPGFGLANFFFSIDHIRLLELVIFLPAFLTLSQRTATPRFGQTTPDKLIAAYVILFAILQMLVTTFTDTLRQAFYLFVDIVLPYYVASRSLKDPEGLRDALGGFVVAAMVLAAVGIFEFLKGWLLYSSLSGVLDVFWGYGNYLFREGDVRALASTGQPIVLGYVLVIAFGFFLFLRKSIPGRFVQSLWLALLIAGLIAPLSRGPWVGAAVLFVVFIATGPQAGKRIAGLAAGGIAAIALMLASPVGEKIIDYLPFVGTVEQANVTYRQLLIENCIKLIRQNPFFGVPDAMSTSELQAMRQGQGIIDIVNTYVAVALGTGLVGLTLFVSIFASIGVGIYTAMRRVSGKNEELHLLGRVLLSTLIAILVMIGTVSSILVIPVIYWSVAGLGLAYIQIVRRSEDAVAPVIHQPSAVDVTAWSA